jgi:hypothetical protein
MSGADFNDVPKRRAMLEAALATGSPRKLETLVDHVRMHKGEVRSITARRGRRSALPRGPTGHPRLAIPCS